ncbi:MAG TPA: DUF1858 domain-containing protein [Dehalococcoidia bacterium]|nr:DUF1858 domain-containing protein [Dehalococcoidia bacterium]
MVDEGGPAITRRTSVREVLRRYPEAAEVFERHGIMGCGGPEGPDEPLAFFALVHRVDPDQLIAELREHIQQRAAPTRSHREGWRPPFALLPIGLAVASALAGIPLGGAMALMAARGTALDARWTALVQAHGQLQLAGWLGLFIVGMALHIVPRFKARPLALGPLRLPTVALWTMALLLRTAAAAAPAPWSGPLLATGASLQLLASVLFAAMVGGTLWGARREGYDWFLLSGLGWLVAGGALGLGGTAAALALGAPYVPAQWDRAQLDVLAYGFVLAFALGVSLRVVPFFLSLPPARQSTAPALALALGAGVAALLARGAWGVATGGAAPALGTVGTAPVALAALGAVASLGVFAPPRPSDAADAQTAHRKFVRAAYVWLMAALAVQLWLVVDEAVGDGAGWPEEGAARHMLLLGFASQLVFGIAYRALPVFVGGRLRSRLLVDLTYVLLNVAAVTRVLPPLVPGGGAGGMWSHVAGAGLPMTLAVGLFGYNLLMTVVDAGRRARRWRETVTVQEVRAVREAQAVTADMTVAQVIERVPGALELLIRRGFTPLADPELRAALAPTITIRGACELRGVDLESLLRDLNALADAQGGE